jgi:hypothetical protein
VGGEWEVGVGWALRAGCAPRVPRGSMRGSFYLFPAEQAFLYSSEQSLHPKKFRLVDFWM